MISPSNLSQQRVGWLSLVLSCAVFFTACIFAPATSGQSAYTVNEPARPNASQAVMTLLAQVEKLRERLQYAEALERAELAKTIAFDAGDPAGEALSQSARAKSLVALGRNPDAVAAWQKSAAAWERAGDGPSQIEPLVSASLQLWRSDKPQAQLLLTRALKVAKVERQRRFAAADELERAATRLQVLEPTSFQAIGGAEEFRSIAISVRHEAMVGKLLDEDKYSEAESLARSWLAKVETKSGPESLETARALDVLANALFVVKVAEIPEKRQLAEHALSIREKALGPHDLEVAQSMYTLARVLWQAGEFREAKSFWERALSIREKELRPDHAAVRIILANLAAVLVDMGDCSAALPLAERFSALVEKAYGPDHPFFGRSLSVLYRAHYCARNFTDARRVTERALAIKEKAWGSNNASVASDRVNLGQLLWEIGDLSEARRNYELALPVFEKLYGNESIFYADGLSGLARVAASAGDYAAARTLQERVVTIYEKALGPKHSDLGMPLIDLAVTLTREGELAQAQPLYERALGLWEQSRGSESPFVALALSQLAGLLQEAGDLVSARQLYERALTIQEKTFGANHVALAQTLRGLAQIRAMNGETKEAFALALRGEEIGRQHWQLIATTLSEREALAYAAERTSDLDLPLTLAAQEGQRARDAWSALIRSRALVLDEMAARHRIVSAGGNPELVRLASALTSARERQARLVVQGPSKDRAELYRTLLDDTRQERERAERQLAEQSQSFRETLVREQVGFDEVSRALPSEAALVAYVRYGHRDLRPMRPGIQRAEPTPNYLAFVWRHSQAEPKIVRLGPAATIETIITTLRQQISQQSRAGERAAKRSEVTYRLAGARLRRAVWDPVLPYVGNARSIFIVPDGALHLVNFAALPTGASHYLIEAGHPFHYLATERDLVPIERRSGEGLLALGMPAFDDVDLFARKASPSAENHAPGLVSNKSVYRGPRSGCGDFQSLHFELLPASAREIEEVAALWTKGADRSMARLRGASVGKSCGVIYLRGSDANEAAFKGQAEGMRVLHLATHGFFLGEQCASATDADTKFPSSIQSVPLEGENPLLLSGLAFAGANYRQSAGMEEEDGILTAEEIASLDLSGTEWAVLSACDTGLGVVKASEGVLGLRRAFQVAGAHTLIMSLWAVEDQATRAWMHELYRQHWVEHQPTIDSVYQASLNALHQRRARHLSTHPFYWAGFVAAGDWR